MSDCIRMNGEDWVRWSWYEQRGEELNDRCADIIKLKAELAEAKAQLDGAFVGLRDMKNRCTAANADADLLGELVSATEALKLDPNVGNLHRRNLAEQAVYARPTAAARVKGTP